MDARKKQKKKVQQMATPTKGDSVDKKKIRLPKTLPMIPLAFLAFWLWATFYYDSVFRICREYSFWVPDAEQMSFVLDNSYGILWYVGRMFLQLFRYPWLGGLFLALILSLGSWLFGYCLRLPSKLRFIQYFPALTYVGIVTYHGLDLFFEAETGRILGIPFVVLLILTIWALMIRSFSRKKCPSLLFAPADETRATSFLQLMIILIGMGAAIGFNELHRPYVRVITELMVRQYAQDWQGMQKLARANAEQSNRPMAAYYAMALVHTDQIATRLYDIRLDYDTLHVHGMDHYANSANAIYVPEASYHAGLVQTSYHNCMEQLVMTGPTVRLLKLMTKCALMKTEWELAEKYLRILKDVPFEGDFCKKYGAMVRNIGALNSDVEMARIRLTEPMRDSFESQYQYPTFMGYNLALSEGRSINALNNSLAVCLYTKLMPDFMMRLAPIKGTTPQENFADGIIICANKQAGFEKEFSGLNFRIPRFQGFMNEIKPYLSDRPKYGKELFSRYKGYYPYYYFFGNLKATKKPKNVNQTSNTGVN